MMGYGSSGWSIHQTWGVVVKEGFLEVMSKLKPEKLMDVRRMVKRREKKVGNSRPREQHVHLGPSASKPHSVAGGSGAKGRGGWGPRVRGLLCMLGRSMQSGCASGRHITW